MLFPKGKKVPACYDLFWNLNSPERADCSVTEFLLDSSLKRLGVEGRALGKEAIKLKFQN